MCLDSEKERFDLSPFSRSTNYKTTSKLPSCQSFFKSSHVTSTTFSCLRKEDTAK